MRARSTVDAIETPSPATTHTRRSAKPAGRGRRPSPLYMTEWSRRFSGIVIFVFYIFAAIQLFLSYKSLRSGLAYLRYFRRELAAPVSGYSPFATVIAPCKGSENGLAENLAALFELDYPVYEIIFVVDDVNDPAAAIIDKLCQTSSLQAKMVLAPTAQSSSQKVENLREAVLHADPRSEAFVFVDSDVRPAPGWLHSLTRPLQDDKVGAATGYRWFISTKNGLASELRSAWNASIASALGPNTDSNFCWGGSMAIRRDTFEKLGIRDAWEGALSDDFAVTRAIKNAGMSVYFVPAALTASIDNCTFADLLEFTNRQMKITRVYAAKLWALSYFGSALFIAVMLASVLLIVFTDKLGLTMVISWLTLILVSVLSIAKAHLRFKAVHLALPHFSRELQRQRPFQLIFWVVTPAIFLVNSTIALFSRRITWRGTRYEMVSPTVTKVLSIHRRW